MKTIILVVAIISLTIGSGAAQAQDNAKAALESADNSSQQFLRNKLGFAASMFSGYGLSYLYHIDRSYAVKLTGSIFGQGGDNQDTYGKSYFVSTLGGELQRNFYMGRSSRFYGLAAASYWIDNTKYYNTPERSNSDDIVAALGIGFEFTVATRIALNVEGGYLYRSTSENGSRLNYIGGPNPVVEAYSKSSYWLGFGAGCGIYYSF